MRRILLLPLLALALLRPADSQDPGVQDRPGRLLIVTPQNLRPALGPYVEHKVQQMPVQIATLESVLEAVPGADDPEKLKRWLYDTWRARGTRYVLLVGDADVMPVRYMVLDRVTAPAFDYAFYPSDLYYADLAKPDGSFEDWNAQKDGFHAGYFGEVRGEKNKDGPINFDAIDYRPEIALGRWPVATPAEVAVVVRKSIAYEKRVQSDGIKGLRTAGVVAAGGWIDSRGLLDAAIGKLPPGWRAERRYYADKGQEPATPPPSEEEIVKLLNGGVGLLVHAGHGSDGSWDGCFGMGSIAKLTNAEHPAIMMSIGCSTARFATLPPYEAYEDTAGQAHKGTNAGEVFTAPPPPPAPYARGPYNPPGLGEQLVRTGPAGAVAYIGCNTGGQPCAATLLDGFVTALGEARAPRLGDLWASAVTRYFEREHLATLVPNADWYPPSIFFQGMKYMLFGDPSLLLPPPEKQ